jgi:hypothetical protein
MMEQKHQIDDQNWQPSQPELQQVFLAYYFK